MRSRKRKSKSKRVSVSERKRSKVLFIESEKGDDSLPSPSDSLYDEKGHTTWAMWSDEDVARKLEDHGLKKAAKIFRGKCSLNVCVYELMSTQAYDAFPSNLEHFRNYVDKLLLIY